MRGGRRVARAVLAVGALGGLLVLAAEFATIASVDVASGSCQVINDANPDLADRCELSGFERHGGAFLLLGLLALAMALGAGPGRSRPAAAAMVAVGAVVLAFALLFDLPVTDETGAIGRNFEGATAAAEAGLWLEIAGSLLTALAGVIRLVAPEAPGAEAPSRGGQRDSAR